MNKEEFKAFFESYAQNVDIANQQNFWKLSDALILESIKRTIPDPGKNGLILDAGGGTARWAILLSTMYRAQFMVFDLSTDMLEKAKANVVREHLERRIVLQQGDLADMHDVTDGSFDHIISIYSPISFIAEKEKAAKEFYRVLRPGGKILIMGHGYFNAIASKINNYHAGAEELYSLEHKRVVKWVPNVPALNVFSRETMGQLLSKAGFVPSQVFGIPVFVQPGPEDFDPENKLQSAISKALEDDSFFNTIFDIEMTHNAEPSVTNRGMNILALAEKKK